MAILTNRTNTRNDILLLFPNPLYTATRIFYKEDLEEMGLGKSLDDVPEATGRIVLMHAKTLARIQPELAFHFLLKFPILLRFIQLEDLTKWVSVVLDKYDSQGLNPARAFILELNDHPDWFQICHVSSISFRTPCWPMIFSISRRRAESKNGLRRRCPGCSVSLKD